VWSITEDDERRLDRYEGYPSFYYKMEMPVTITGIRTGKQHTRRCFVYIMHEDRPLGLPGNAYLETCCEGYIDFGFDRQKLIDACKDSAKEEL